MKIDDFVTTISNNTVLKSECRNIKGEYYKIGDINIIESGDCYFINGKYYKQDTGYIVYDYRVKQYVIKNMNNLVEGVVQIENKRNVVFGMFSLSGTLDDQIYLHYQGLRYRCLNEDILKDTYFLEDLSTGEYHYRGALRSIYFNTPFSPPNGFKEGLLYDSHVSITDAKLLYNKYYTKPLSKTVEKYGYVVKDLTFGFEFETTKGFIPQRICSKLGLIPVRDGSIEGLEYVTIPLEGPKGIQTVIDVTKELQKRTEYNNDCSLHLHIGNIPRTEEFCLALFKVLYILQDQMFALFPLYKKYNYGIKRKHYTKPLPLEVMALLDRVINSSNIKRNFSVLYKFLSGGQDYDDVNYNLTNVKYHPSDPRGGHKWDIRTRYFWVNMIPLIFGNKETVEFRIHTPTDNTDKVINYLILCTSIINYVKNNQELILEKPENIINLYLSDIVTTTVDNITVADTIYRYINKRKEYIFYKTQKGDLIANEDDLYIQSRINWTNGEDINDAINDYSNLLIDYRGFNVVRQNEPIIRGEIEEIELNDNNLDDEF